MNWLKRTLTRRRHYEELAATIHEHLDEKIADLMDHGMTRDEAERTAHREFGNVTRIEECSREVWEWVRLKGLLHDIRYGARRLCKSPGFTAVAILTLALGIGANTAVFSALNALLLKMLPVQNPQEVYTVLLVNGGTQPPNTSGTGHGNTSFSFPVYQALRNESRVFTSLIAHIPLGFGRVPVRYDNTPTAKAGEEVSGNYFSGLGVAMLRGLGFTEADERDHSSKVVISYSFWTEAFSRDPSALGKTLYIKNVPFTIVGVTPPPFYGVDPGSAVDFWIPLQTRPELNAWGVPVDSGTLYGSPKWWAVPMVARLAPGVSPQQAQQVLQPVFWQAASIGLGTIDPKQWPAHLGFASIQGIGSYEKFDKTPLKIMMALVALVLVIACTNVALLVVARNIARQREFAIRIATGARPSQIFRQLLTESVLLVFAGASLGWILSIGATRALALWARIDTGLAPDRLVLLFTLLTSSLVAFVFSLVPFRSALLLSVDQALKSANQSISQTRRQIRSGNAVIAFQVAMCFTLLVAAGLTVRTLLNYESQDLGMRADDLLIFDVNPQGLTGQERIQSFYNRLLDEIKAVPGVEAASLVQTRFGSGWLNSGGIRLDGRQLQTNSGSKAEVYSNSVGPDFFGTTGISVLQGRDISEADTSANHRVSVVNETFAKEFLNNEALGHHVENGIEIVGVVKDSKYRSVTEKNMPTIYYSLAQAGMHGQVTVEVRSSRDPMSLLPTIERTVHNLDSDLPVQNPMKQTTQFEKSYLTPMLFARLSLGFGVLATILVATGLYGTLVYRLQRRRAEIGIRMALGAARGQVLRMIVNESISIAGIGFGLGIPFSLIVSRLLRSQLYQVTYFDPATFGIAIGVTLFVAVGASLFPAQLASRVDPVEALRAE